MKNLPRRDGEIINLEIAEKTEIIEGALVALTIEGYAVDATDVKAKKIVGRADNSAFNLSGNNGDETVNVHRKNAFLFQNATVADEIKQEHLFTDCYLVDADTVATTDGGTNRLVVGKVIEISQEGVWVEIA